MLILSAVAISVAMACNSKNGSSSTDPAAGDTSMRTMGATGPMQDTAGVDTTGGRDTLQTEKKRTLPLKQ